MDQEEELIAAETLLRKGDKFEAEVLANIAHAEAQLTELRRVNGGLRNVIISLKAAVEANKEPTDAPQS
jgi:hypothetical protein